MPKNAVFQAPIPGLNQNEASFRVIQINHAEFKSILRDLTSFFNFGCLAVTLE